MLGYSEIDVQAVPDATMDPGYGNTITIAEPKPEDLKNDPDMLAGCVAGAVLKEEYLKLLKKAGFSVEILAEDPNLSKRQYGGLPVESLKLKAWV